MAITVLSLGYIPEKGINYTHITDSSLDWSAIPINTYFYDKSDKLPHYKNSLGEVLDIFSEDQQTAFIPSVGANEVFRGLTYRYNSTTSDAYAGFGVATSASTSAQVSDTSIFSKKFIRLRYYASIVQTGRYTGVRGNSEFFYRGTGFRFVTMFRVADTVYSAGCQQFYGLGAGTVDLPYGGVSLIQLSTLSNIIGVGSEASDTNLQIFHNDASGTCTKVDLGSGFPANRGIPAVAEMSTMYAIQIYNGIGSLDVKYEVINLETGETARGTLTTDLPLDTQGLNIFASRTMNAPTTNTGQFELAKWGCYSI